MKSIKEFVTTKILIEKLSQPLEDYINNTGGDTYLYDKRFDQFGNNWNEHTIYLYETLLYSYSLDKFREYISKIFNILYYEKDSDSVLYCRFGKDFDPDNKEFQSACNLFNVFVNKIEKRSDNIVDVCFEQRKPNDITKSVYADNDYLLHLTQSSVVDKILKYGLQPKAHSKKSYHPERIYLFSQHIPERYISNMLNQLSCDTILKVDIKKLKEVFGKTLTLYEDPMTSGNYGMFTENTIYPDIISVFEI